MRSSHLAAGSSFGRKGTASAADVAFRARGIHVLAEALIAVVRAGEVGHACIIRDEALLLGELVHCDR